MGIFLSVIRCSHFLISEMTNTDDVRATSMTRSEEGTREILRGVWWGGGEYSEEEIELANL